MNLFFSSLTTCFIVGCIWFLALMQPQQAIANQAAIQVAAQETNLVTNKLAIQTAKPQLAGAQPPMPVTKISNADSSAVKFNKVEIVGLTKLVKLEQISSLWSEFNNNQLVNSRLIKAPSKVFVYYRDFTSSYMQSKVTIGYDISELRGSSVSTVLPNTKFYPLLEKGDYSESELAKAWNKINYLKSPQAVLEVHHLNRDGSVAVTETLVSYK